MGVNLGRLGFLTEIPVSEAILTLDSFLAGDTSVISPRWLLEARTANAVSTCLNDVVVTKGAVARMIELTIGIDGKEVATLRPMDSSFRRRPARPPILSRPAGRSSTPRSRPSS